MKDFILKCFLCLFRKIRCKNKILSYSNFFNYEFEILSPIIDFLCNLSCILPWNGMRNAFKTLYTHT